MQLIETLHIHTILLPDRTAFLFGTDDGEPVPAQLWAPSFFLWDEDSYYGTQLNFSHYDGQSGIILSPFQFLKVLAQEPFNSFISWSWSELSSVALSLSQSLYETVDQGAVLPDFTKLAGNGPSFELPFEVLDEFGDSFWTQPVEYVNPDGEISTTTVRQFAGEWLNEAMKDRPGNQKIGALFQALAEKTLDPTRLQAFFDEQRWAEWTGTVSVERPFQVGFRLDEPNFDVGDAVDQWSIKPFVRGLVDEEKFFLWEDRRHMPAAWKKYNKDAEREINRVFTLFPEYKGDFTEEKAWQFLTDTSEILHLLGVEILLPSWWQAIKDARISMKAKVKQPTGRRQSFVGMNALLDYNWRFSVNGADLSEDDFNKLVEEKRRLIYIKGKWVKLDPAFLKRMQEMKREADAKGIRLNDLLQQELTTEGEEPDEDEEAYARIQFELNGELRRLMSKLTSINNIPQVDVPAGLHGILRPYQQQGMSWLLFMREYGFGACLADDMGLGKTVQLIGYLLAVKEGYTQTALDDVEVAPVHDSGEGVVEAPSLIICPTSVLGNWQKELERFSPSLNVKLHYGQSRHKGDTFNASIAGADVVLTSYGLLHQDEDEFHSVNWNAVVLDEAQNIKNAHTKQSRAARKLTGIQHIALTGTPMENRLSELWSIFDFINKGFLGTQTHFDKTFATPIERNGDKDKIAALQKLIQPFLLRRTKKDEDVALNLPDKLEQKEFVTLTPEQAALYEQLVKDTLDQVEKLNGFERKGLILQMLTKLKQICNHPALYLKEESPKHILHRSGKMEKLAELLDSVNEQKESVLIFTQYIEMGNMIKRIAERRYGYKVPFLNGSMPKNQRDILVERFQAGDYPIFLLSLKAGGTGLNLTEANHVIHYDRWWNPAVENQATDRAYRIGQTRFVHVHKMVASGTLEEKIDAMLEKKQLLNDEIVQSDNWITELSTDALKDLLVLER